VRCGHSYNNGNNGVGSPSFACDVLSGNPDWDALSNVAIDRQGLAGVLTKATDLVSGNALSIRYDVSGEDVSGSGASLVDCNNPSFYPQS
jgi:hypothetical protein